jgi:hypothetical protein
MTNASKTNSRVSSKTRIAVANDGKKNKYIVKGVYPTRKRSGIAVHEMNEQNCDRAKSHISLFCRLEEKAKGYIDARQLLFLDAVRSRAQYGGLSFGNEYGSAIWPSVAFGKNVFLNAHRDEDYFWSLTTTVTKNGCATNDEILNYFCFPTKGFCVAMRTGDILLFNALVDHCASSVCKETTELYGVSLYLKTAVVAGNNNNQQNR